MKGKVKNLVMVERLNKMYRDSGCDTQGEFAERLGVSRQTLGHWLNGERAPDADNLKDICDVMGVTVDWLLGKDPLEMQSADKELRFVRDYSGLSEKAVSLLRFVNNNSPDYVSALSYLLEDVGFYRSVLTSVSLFIKHRQLAAGAVKEFDDFMEIATDKELDLLERLSKDYGIEYSGPAQVMFNDADNAGNGLSSILRHIASDLISPSKAINRYYQMENEDWLASLKKEYKEEEKNNGQR